MDASRALAIDAPHRYRITPWPVLILAPLVVLIAALGAIGAPAAPDVLGCALLGVFACAQVYAARRCGVYTTSSGIESRMMRRSNSFRIPWSEIERFTVLNGPAQLAIVVHLADGRRKILPSTRAWRYDRREVESICRDLNRDRTAAALLAS